jgi:adenosylhomocysteinase
VRWVSCNIFSTQDEAAAAVVVGPTGTPERPEGTSVFAWKGETLQEYWWCTDQMFRFPGANMPNLIVDDGGDATLLVHKGVEFEAAGAVPRPAPDEVEEYAIVLETLAASLAEDPQRFTRMASGIRGVSEETTNGVSGGSSPPRHLLPRSAARYQVQFDNVRHPALAGGRAVDASCSAAKLSSAATAASCAAEALRGQGARVVVTEVDPICALQAAMDGLQVVLVDDVVDHADVFITATGNRDILLAAHMQRMKHNAIVANVGHFDTEIDMAGLARVPGVVKTEIKPQVHEWAFPDGHSVIVLSEGRLMNLGNATGHPSFVMSNSFANQTIAQIELFTKTGEYDRQVYRLPKQLDEKVARLHLNALGARLTPLTKVQAEYIGVDVDGPFKADHYRY